MLVMMLRTVTFAGALPLVLVAHDCVGRGSLRREALVEPRQRRRDPRVLIAQPLHELHRKGVRRAGPSVAGEHHRHRFGRASATPSSRSARSSASSRAVRLLHDPSASRRRFSTSTMRSVIATAQSSPIVSGWTSDRPGRSGTASRDRSGCRCGRQKPRRAEHARISGERTVSELRQLPVIARRQVVADLADLLLDEMIVVEQPFGRRGDRAPSSIACAIVR